MQAAVDSCKEAYKSWSKTTPLYRQQLMFKLQHLIKDNMVSKDYEFVFTFILIVFYRKH